MRGKEEVGGKREGVGSKRKWEKRGSGTKGGGGWKEGVGGQRKGEKEWAERVSGRKERRSGRKKCRRERSSR